MADFYEFRVIDVQNPSTPYQVGSFTAHAYYASVDVIGSYAFAIDGDAGLFIIQTPTPEEGITLILSGNDFQTTMTDTTGLYNFSNLVLYFLLSKTQCSDTVSHITS